MKKTRVKRNCEWCNKEFEAKLSVIKIGHGRFCSQSCASSLRQSKVINNKIEIPCDICGASIFRWASEIKENNFCSRYCYSKWRKTRVGEKGANWQGGPIVKTCYCGKPFTTTMPRIKDGRGKHCSKECYLQWYTGKFRGENHWHWKGGPKLYPPEWTEELRESIRLRDGHICKICKLPERKHKIPVHHIDYDKQNNGNDNLMCLCTACHSTTNYNRDYWQESLGALCKYE